MSASELSRLEAYLQTTLGHNRISVSQRSKTKDSAEVSINGEFIGTIYKDEEDGETSYDFNMAILDIDLPKTAGK
ncbi:MAG: DUF3126 family protein [Alphaproteobacteria bacterium]|nr:DUF3126 family protein [Alphaproteobacteria bacterium]